MTISHFMALGECMVEIAPAGGDGLHRVSYAGDTFNTAWYLKRLSPAGVRVSYVTAVGTDRVSQDMMSFMNEAGIDTDHVTQVGDATVGAYMVHVDKGERSFSYWRTASAARNAWRFLPETAGLASSNICLHISGISIAIADEEGRAALVSFMAAMRGQGAVVSFDPNMRPSLWQDGDTMRRWVMRAASEADFLLPSLDEEMAHFGDADARAVAARYHAAGAGTILVKNGPEPGFVFPKDASALQFIPEPVNDVVDTTAAGDSFNAGFLAAFSQGQSLAEAAANGARVAARVVQGQGALVDI